MSHLPNNTESNQRFSMLPQTASGHWAVRLCLVFFVLFVAWLVYVQAYAIPRPTFFSDPLHAVLILSAAIAAIAGAFLAVFSLIVKGERSILVIVSFLVGAFVLYWALAETMGH